MQFRLLFTREASENLDRLEADQGLSKRLKAVRKALALLERNPRHPGLNTHRFSSLRGPDGEEVFEAYAESRAPAAYPIFWIYGPEQGQITVIAMTSHP